VKRNIIQFHKDLPERGVHFDRKKKGGIQVNLCPEWRCLMEPSKDSNQLKKRRKGRPNHKAREEEGVGNLQRQVEKGSSASGERSKSTLEGKKKCP